MRNGRLELWKTSYINQILASFGLTDCQTYATPMNSNFFDELAMHKDDKKVIDNSYQNMIGSLQFLTLQTRTDIATAVGILSQYCTKPTAFLVKSVKRVFGFLKGTSKFGLQNNLKKNPDEILKFFSEADFPGNKIDRNSRSGWLAKAFGYTFLWNRKRQTFVSLLTTAPEYIALCDAICEPKFFWIFLAEIGFTMDNSTHVKCDNYVSNMSANNVKSVKRSKHMDIKNHFLKQMVEIGQANVNYVESENNEPGGFTKSLGTQKFEIFRKAVWVQQLH